MVFIETFSAVVASGAEKTGFGEAAHSNLTFCMCEQLTGKARASHFTATIEFDDLVILDRHEAQHGRVLNRHIKHIRTLVEPDLKTIRSSACQNASRDQSRVGVMPTLMPEGQNGRPVIIL